jgi:signal transduction histidine kinase
MKLRTHLVLLVIATALPIIAFAAGLVVHSARLERDAFERGLRDTARALGLALDRDVRDIKTAVQTLVSSRYLDEPPDLRRFYEDAHVVSSSVGGWAVLSDTTGQQLINTSRPFGEVLPLPPPDSLAMMQDVARQRQPFVSNVIIGTVSRRPAVIIVVPVIRRDRVVYLLDFPFEPVRFTHLLQEAALSPQWIGIITDRAGGVVARVPAREGVVGQTAPAPWVERTGGVEEGFAKGALLSRVQVYAAHWRSKETGWTVGVAAPVEVVDRPFWRSLRSLAIGGAALVAVALTCAFLLGQRVAAPIVALARSLTADPRVARPPRAPRSAAVVEVDELQRALDDAEVRARLLSEAEAANREKDVFLAMLSHELRTPLHSMMGWIALLRSGQLDAAKTARALEVIDRNAAQQARLIDDLLDVSRIVMDRLPLQMDVVDWPGLVAGVVESARPSADARSIRLTSELAQDAGPVRGDAERLRQVVGNLLTNAIKFTPEGGAVTVTLVRDNCARLTVTDTGRGIDPDLLPHVFDRFRQGEDPGRSSPPGLGLGLAIVRHLVEAHGGTVGARSDGLGAGATLTVDLPIARPDESGATEVVSSRR